ncbi:MAG: response regulator [Desulfobacterales bacterium]
MRDYEILLVDDDALILDTLGPAIESAGYRVTTAANGTEAIEKLTRCHFDLVLTDLVMESVDGIGVVKKAKEVNPDAMAIILTGFGGITSAIDALRLGADDYLLKPCENEEILFRISTCLEKLEFKRKIKAYEEMLPVCCVCKKIRDDSGKEPGSGEFMSVEQFIVTKAGLSVTSTYCPECGKKAIEELNDL